MISSWFTLDKLRIFLENRLVGAVFSKALSFRKNELILLNADPSGASLLLHLFDPFQYILLRKFAEPGRHIRIFPAFQNEILDSISLDADDRNLRLAFRSGFLLIIFYRSSSGNVLSISPSGEQTAFKKGSLPDVTAPPRNDLSPEAPGIATDPRFNRFWKKNIHELFATQADSEIYRKIQQSSGQVIGQRFVLNSSPHDHFDPDEFYRRYSAFITGFLKEHDESLQKGEIQKFLQDRMSKTARSLKERPDRPQLEERKDRYRYFADCLNAARHLVPPGSDSFSIPDYLRRDDMPLDIPLSSASPVQSDIDHFYNRASELEKQIAVEEVRQLRDRKLYSELQQALEQLNALQTKDELFKFRENWKSLFNTESSGRSRSGPEEALPYREYVSPAGLKVWVGRSASQNDDLSFHYAAKKDLWFHTRHGRGSHVILKCADRKHVDRADLEFAASLAARFSEEKHASLVSVVYTEKKYVSKLKGGGPGKVRYQYEKDILIAPASLKHEEF